MVRPYPCVAALVPEERAQVYFIHRVNYLPIALERTRAKLRRLEAEALSYGMTELLEVGQHG